MSMKTRMNLLYRSAGADSENFGGVALAANAAACRAVEGNLFAGSSPAASTKRRSHRQGQA